MARHKQTTELITGIDIGSTHVRIAVGQATYGDGPNPHIQVIGAVDVPSEGVHRGTITSIEDVVSSITSALEQVERVIGVPVEDAWVGMSAAHILSQPSKGVVAVAKSDGEISEEDVMRAVETTRMVAPPLNYEVLHVIPRTFSVDGQTGIKDPVGMTGIRLEVDTQIIYGLSPHIKNITKAVYRTGIDINDLVVSLFAVADIITTARQRELGVAVVDIGGATTNVVVYEAGDIVHTASLPIGSLHITNDLAIGLRTSIDVAEQVKVRYGNCLAEAIERREMIDLSDCGGAPGEAVEKAYTAEIVSARVSEIFEKIDAELRKIQRSGLLPSGIVFTGGGAKLNGLVDYARRELRLPASLGYPMDIQSATDKVQDLAFATAVGLITWGAQIGSGGAKKKKFSFSGGKVYEKMQKFFKTLIP